MPVDLQLLGLPRRQDLAHGECCVHELKTMILSIASKAMRLCREVVKLLLSPIWSLES
jgi:hypothetical protein